MDFYLATPPVTKGSGLVKQKQRVAVVMVNVLIVVLRYVLTKK